MKKITNIAWVSYINIIGIAICGIATSSYNPVSALEYTTNYGNSFTLLPSISVSLSSASSTGSADLVIDDLLPNSSQDSNEIIVNVESNNVSGYVLNSSVGSSTNPHSTYGRNLTNATSSNYTFTSLDYNDSKESLTDPNTWGYSYATTSTTNVETGSNEWNWSNYSGLPLYSDTTNIATLKSSNTPSSANGDNIGFKIAAKASITQGSGEYTNIINFIAVGNPTPTSFYDAFTSASEQPGSTITKLNGYYKMQDMSKDICSAIQVEESQISLIDARDNNVYTVAKLKDNRCWMTSNLNIAGGTLLNSDTTDFDASYSLPTDQNWQSDGRLPESSTAGFNQNNYAYVYNSGNNTTTCTSSQPCYSYYSWDVATLGSGRSIGAEDTDAPYSICPKGWRLPTSGNQAMNDPSKQSGWKRGDFYRLATAYGVNLESNYYSSTTTFYNNAGPGTKASFLLAGSYDGGQFYVGGASGRYWSSTSYGDTSHARYLGLSSDAMYSANGRFRFFGFSVRCIVDN